MQFLKIESTMHRCDGKAHTFPLLVIHWNEILTMELRGIQHYSDESCRQSYQSFLDVFHFVPWWEFHSTLNHYARKVIVFLWLLSWVLWWEAKAWSIVDSSHYNHFITQIETNLGMLSHPMKYHNPIV